MADILATRESISRNRERGEDLLTEVLQLAERDDKPSIRLTIFLSRRPEVTTASLIELVEKGLLEMEIRLKDPQRLLPRGKAVVKKSELQVYNLVKDHLLKTAEGLGSEAVFRLRMILSADECLEAQKALEDKPSGIHIRGSVVFGRNEKNEKITFTLPLRKLVNHKCSINGKDSRHSLITVRYFDPVSAGYNDAPVFVTSRAVKSRSSMTASTRLVAGKNELVNPVMLLRPASSFTKINNPGISLNNKNKLWYLDDIRIKTVPVTEKPSLPVIKDGEEAVWADSANPKKIWYLPEYRILEPLQSDTQDESPFMFTFQKIGSDNNGRPVLQGTVRISLTENIPAAASERAKSVAGSNLAPVIIKNRNFVLQLPFVDQNGSPGVTDISPSETTVTNNVVRLAFHLTDNWIRNCYGVLSIESFQPSGAGIKVFTCFSGLSKVQKSNVKLLAPANFLKLNLVKTGRDTDDLFYDINTRTLKTGFQQVRFTDRGKARGPSLKTNVAIKAAKASNAVVANYLVAKPGTSIPPGVSKGEDLVERSFGKEQAMDIFFPCKTFGQFYVEQFSDGNRKTIGCYEPYRMGEIQFRLYEELTFLSTRFYKVHRSLQSPDHFLVQPSRYRITRFGKDHSELAFRPCAHMYGAIDEKDNFQSSYCLLDMCLEPEIPEFEFHLLKQELKKQSNRIPVIEFPGEITADAAYNWSLPAETKIDTLNLGRSVQVTVTVDIMQVLTLQAMLKNGALNGQAIYTMADSTKYTSDLSPDTANITGPWGNGPLDIMKNNSAIVLRNTTEKTVQLTKVLLSDSEDKNIDIQIINRIMPPGDSFSIASQDNFSRVIADCSPEIKAAELDETFIFVDDLSCQVIFSTDMDFTERNITGIDVEASFVEGPEKTFSGQLTPDNPAIEFESLIPLTGVAGPRIVNYRVRAVSAGDPPGFSGWKQWSVKEQGNIINITSDLVLKI